MLRRAGLLVAAVSLSCAALSAQQPPRPFPQPSQPRPSTPVPKQPVRPAPAIPAPTSGSKAGAPNEAALGAPIYPTAVFLTSYDAGRGQRFYLFGVALSYEDAVTYYRSTLKTRGEVLFDSPPTHQFDIARFDDDTMAFPPSVTIKDYTWGGSPGYPNPIPGGQPERFPTIIQIVPAPAAVAQ